MSHPFIVGEAYFDRKGAYVVQAIDKTKLKIRYEDGSEQTAEIADKERIYRNILGEERTFHPFQSAAYFQTLGFFSRRADFQAEVPPQSQPGFESQYEMFTRSRPILGSDGYYPVRAATSWEKWGPELRIYFPDDRRTIEIPNNIEIRSGSADGTLRINNNGFWWQLIRVGFRLGVRHQVALIRQTVPKQYQADFDRGLR